MTVHDDSHPESDDQDQGLFSLDTSVSSRAYVAEIWKRRDFALSLPIEELQSSHKDTLFGNIWHLGNPLLTAGVYYLVFGKFLEVSRGIDNFVVWLIIGVFTYQLTAGTILGGASSIASRQGLMRSFRFPRAIVPISNMIGELLAFAFQFLVIVIFAFATGVGPSRRWFLLPVILLIHTAFNLGGSFIAARLNDGFRDIQQLIPFVLRLAMYASGVMFPLDRIVGRNDLVDWLVRLNPIASLINFYRWMILGTDLNVATSALTVVESMLILWFGFRFFKVAEYRYGQP